MFGHENLLVYKKSLEFIPMGDSLLNLADRPAVARDHLVRAMEGIPLHIARAHQAWSAQERILYLGHANGSVLECAACLDVLVAKQLLTSAQTISGKRLLHHIASMLIAMQKSASDRVREDSTQSYATNRDVTFSHERLDVYQVALGFVAWVDARCSKAAARCDLVERLDRTSTGIVLNIAEGNGRFTPADHARFLGMAQAATVQYAAALDLAVTRQVVHADSIREGRQMLVRICAMLTAMAKLFHP